MPLANRERSETRCHQCDAKTTRLGRLPWLTPSGKILHLSVCRFCYAQLQRQQKATLRR